VVTDQAMKNLDGEAIRRGRKVGIDPGIMRLAIEAQRRGRPFVVETEDVQGDVHFYRCQQEGSSRVLYLNVAHPFFSEVYMAAGSTPEYRAGLEVLLWVLGNAEVEAGERGDADLAQWYALSRGRWSQLLGPALRMLAEQYPATDDEQEWDQP